jgi:hypothetical protein
MTQTYRLDEDRMGPVCGAVHPAGSGARCDLGEGHVGVHLAASGHSWPAHVVLRLDSTHADTLPRLAQLCAVYDIAKRAADDAAAALKVVTDGIKVEASAAVPGGTDFTIVSGALDHPLTLQLVQSQRVDTALLRTMLGEKYHSVCKPSSAWVLKRKR